MMVSFSEKMPICHQKGQKGAKMGGVVGQNELFLYIAQNWIRFLDYIYLIFCTKLEGIKGYKLPQTSFWGNFSCCLFCKFLLFFQ